jgi:hypothetical protein
MSIENEGEIRVTAANDSGSLQQLQQQLQPRLIFLTTDEFLCRHLFAFLSANDVTNVGMTCRKLHEIFDSSRSSATAS